MRQVARHSAVVDGVNLVHAIGDRPSPLNLPQILSAGPRES